MWTCETCQTQNAADVAMCGACGSPSVSFSRVPVAQRSAAAAADTAATAALGAASAVRPNEPAPVGSPGLPDASVTRGVTAGVAIAIVVVVLAIAAGLVVVLGGRGDDGAATTAGPDSAASEGEREADSAESPTTAATVPETIATTTAAPATTTLVPLVTVGAASADPQVVDLFEVYFRAINAHDFPTAHARLSARMQAKTPLNQMEADAGTTSDEDIYLESMAVSAGDAIAVMSFTSRQDSSDSRSGSTCTLWRVQYRLVPAGGGWAIDGATGVDGAPPSRDC